MPSSGGQTCALRSEEHTSELQAHDNLVCPLPLEKKKTGAPERAVCAGRCDSGGPPVRRALRSAAAGAARRATVFPRVRTVVVLVFFFFFNDTATTEIYTLSLHDALPICLKHTHKNLSKMSLFGSIFCCLV